MTEDLEEKAPKKIEGEAHKLPTWPSESDVKSLRPLSIPVRVLLLLGGVIAPLICHGFALKGPPMGPEWQSGLLSDKLAFALSGIAGYPMYPLLGFCIVSMAVYLYDQNLKHFAWKLGIYSGIPVALWYLFLFDLVVNETTSVLEGIAANLGAMLFASAIAAAILGLIKLAHNLSPGSQVTESTRNYSKKLLVSLLLIFVLSLIASRGGAFFGALIATLFFWRILGAADLLLRLLQSFPKLTLPFQKLFTASGFSNCFLAGSIHGDVSS